MKKDLLIYGAGGMGRTLYDSVIRCVPGRWREILFIDDFVEEQEYYGTRTVHFDTVRRNYRREEMELLIAVGEPLDRKMLYQRIKTEGFALATYMDPMAIISHTARIGEGVIVMPRATIDSNAVVEDNAVIQIGSCASHDVHVGSHCVVSPYSIIGGCSSVGEGTFVGMQATLKDHIHIGRNVIVAMGAVVIKDVADDTCMAGNPAACLPGKGPRVFPLDRK